MKTTRRTFLESGMSLIAAARPLSSAAAKKDYPDNRAFSIIQNNDINGILVESSGKELSPDEYQTAVRHLLEGGPKVLAQNVGLPDPVIYRSTIATTLDKYLTEVALMTFGTRQGFRDAEHVGAVAAHQADALQRLFTAGTDPLGLTIEMCRRRDTLIVASYRMNAEDWYHNTWKLSELGRAHPDWRIPGTGALDPAISGVYNHRVKMFKEAAEEYDIDGIEFDFRRWTHMVSNPLQNHPTLTRMVEETRQILREAARKRRRDRLLLGVRVGPSLADPPGTEYAGGNIKNDLSCRDLGLDVKTWIEKELVDYVCPSLFWPRLPGLPKTAEFVALAKDKKVGIYPTIFPLPAWGQDKISIPDLSPAELRQMMQRHRDEICNAALKCYADGADGISTYNWSGYSQYSYGSKRFGTKQTQYRGSLPYMKTEQFVHRFLGNPEAVGECLRMEPKVTLHVDWPD